MSTNPEPRAQNTGHHEHDVVIVGGGIAGLAAAFELRQRGVSAVVLEAEDRVGGVVRTERFDGWVIDAGPDALLVQKPGAVALCRELGIEDRLVTTLTPRTAYVLRDDHLHPLSEGSFLGFPIGVRSLATSSLFTLGGKLRMACDVFLPRADGDEDESIATFVRRRFGQEAVDYLAEPLLAGIHAGDVEQLSVRALFPRLPEAERQAGSVIRAMRSMRLKPSPRGAFVSFPGGISELIDALAGALPPETITLSARATTIMRAGKYLVQSSAGVFESSIVIVAVPAYAAATLFRAFDTSLAAACDSLPYASTATVAFGYRRDQIAHPLQGTGFVVPRVERRTLLAATWVTSKWPGRAPPGHVLMRGFLGGGRDPHRLDRSDAELVQSARQELEELLGITGQPLFARVFRFHRQSPQYNVGHLERVSALEARLSGAPGLFMVGSGFRAIGIPDCIADGRATAARAASLLATKTTKT